jgi:hypothetical protein
MAEEPSFTCPFCGMTSFSVNDVEHRFCGHCKVFITDDLIRIIVAGTRRFAVEDDRANLERLVRELGPGPGRDEPKPDGRYLAIPRE